MEALQGLANQLHFSLTTSQIIISLGILALGAIWGRLKAGALLSLGTFAYWSYIANEPVLSQMAVNNVHIIVLTGCLGMFLGFMLIYAWVAPSSR